MKKVTGLTDHCRDELSRDALLVILVVSLAFLHEWTKAML